MSAFSSLPVFLQTLIPFLLFLEAVLELGLFIYQISHRYKSIGNLLSLVIFVFLLTLLFSVTQGDPFKGKDAFLLDAPWQIFITVILLVILPLLCRESTAAERRCSHRFPLKMLPTSYRWVYAMPTPTGVLFFAMTVCAVCHLR